jgi:hypothetical protein
MVATPTDGQATRPVGVVHVHSEYSRDGVDPLARIRDRAVAAHIRFVALTDHAEDFDAARFARYTAECAALSDQHVVLIPGLEFRFAEFRGLHLLACGLSRWIEVATPDAFIRETTGICGLTVLAHPILTRYHVPLAVADGINAVEVWNAAYNTRYLPDPRAIALFRAMRGARPEVVAVVGLDQHDGANDRRARVVLTSASDLAAPLAAMRAGRFRNRGQTMSFSAQLDWSNAGLAVLFAVRGVFDRLERAQERVLRAWRRRAARTAKR